MVPLCIRHVNVTVSELAEQQSAGMFVLASFGRTWQDLLESSGHGWIKMNIIAVAGTTVA